MGLLWEIIIGILAGFSRRKIVKGSGMGILIDLLVGIVGSVHRRLGFHLARSRCVRADRPARNGHHRRDHLLLIVRAIKRA